MENRKNPAPRIIFFIILIAVAGVYLYMDKSEASLAQGSFVFAETETKFPISFEDRASVYSNGNKFFYLSTKDGVKYVSSAGAIKWDKVYSMIEPVLKGRGEYAAVCDNRGYVFYFLGPAGVIYEKKYDAPIIFFTVGARGDAGIILQEEENYRFIIIDASGETIFEYVYVEDNIMPVSLDISGDGRLVAVSFLDINNIRFGSKIGFMYTSVEGKNYSKSIIAGIECEDIFIACVYFGEGNRLLYLSDAELACIDVEAKNGPEIIWKKSLSYKISAFAPGEKYFAVSYAEGLNANGPEYEGLVEIFTYDGRAAGSYDFADLVVYISSAADNFIVTDGKNAAAINSKGSLIWEYAALSEIKKFVFADGINAVALQSNTVVSVLRRVKA